MNKNLVETVEITREITRPSLKPYHNYVTKLLNTILEHPKSLNFVTHLQTKLNTILDMIYTNSIANGIIGPSGNCCAKLYQTLQYIAKDIHLVVEKKLVDYVVDRNAYYVKNKKNLNENKFELELRGELEENGMDESSVDRVIRIILNYEYK